MRTQETENTSSPPGAEVPLPSGFESIEQIKNMPSPRLVTKPFVNVIGFVHDFQPPIKTRGTDFKCTMEIKDFSSRFETRGLKVNMFATEEKMPRVGARDAVLIRKAKAQMWSGDVSLLTNFITEIHVLRAASIPKSLTSLANIPWISKPPLKSQKPDILETNHVIWAHNNIDQSTLPTSQEFEVKTMQAVNVREKYSLLQHVKEGSFHDIIGEVRKIYGASYDMLTIYLSDYTANVGFYNYTYNGVSTEGPEGRDGDDFGYLKGKPKTEDRTWKGPYGKMTIQITCFEHHAHFIRENVKEGHWLKLKNIHFSAGKGCLEGKLRVDRDAWENKVQIEILEQQEDQEEVDPRWKDCVRRKRDYFKKFEKQRKELRNEATGVRGKRKADSEAGPAKNSKQRRKELRAAAEAKIAAKKEAEDVKTKPVLKVDLNINIQCNYPDKAPISLSEIIQPLPLSPDPEHAGKCAPFSNQKFKANVRVVDYFPHDIRDFAVGRRVTEYDMLSDCSSDEESEFDNLMDMDSFAAQRKWEWRFALVVEDADPDGPKHRTTLIVGNSDAQMLLNIEADACNLRANPEVLHAVKEQLFNLWGDLEEQKSALLLAQQAAKKKRAPDPPSTASESDSEQPVRYQRDVLPPDDSDDEYGSKKVREAAKRKNEEKEMRRKNAEEEKNKGKEQELQPKNKPFTCCIREYGVQVSEDDEKKMDAGEGKRWERVFGLFGTMIR
ncbi:telomere-binding alpha subunit central domain-containing protein [Rutstroemia sp. NJR-2017a BVV2]|nr:telomere-binding alpha subunit central domain-containing protein [Rutstroemia sp. NJR-2017a BVV2]